MNKLQEHFRLLCRLCGRTIFDSVKIHDRIQMKDGKQEAPLTEKIFDCVGLQITKIDQLPQQMCQTCFNKINDYFEFRMLCELTNVELRKLRTIITEKTEIEQNNKNVNHQIDVFHSSESEMNDVNIDDDSDYYPDKTEIKIENISLSYQNDDEQNTNDNDDERISFISRQSKCRKRSCTTQINENNSNTSKAKKSKDLQENNVDIPYEFIVGNRTDGKVLYLPNEEQLFLKNTNYGDYERYLCRVKNCNRSVSYHIPTKKIVIKSITEHNHGSRYDEYQKILVETKIKEAVAKLPNVDLQSIYNDIVSKSNVNTVSDFKTMYRTLRRIRTKSIFKQKMCREETL